jgi:hypothetical protein
VQRWIPAVVLVLAPACATTAQPIETSPPPKPSYVLPAVEIVAFDAALHAFDRRYLNETGAFSVTPATIRRNLRAKWVVDDDLYEINQVGHPYQGSMYHGFARSAGLNYWAASAYTFAGSLMWEIAGETSTPSINDQIASGIAGSFLGEALFRTANLLIDKADNRPGFGRMLLVLFLSPPTAANRALFGDRFDRVMPTRDPMYDARMQAGASRDETMVDLSLDYGLPGTPTYDYRRPFDNFNVHAMLSSRSGLESFMTRGLLAGQDYARGMAVRGVWGLYGSYDYLSPELFRVSTTALSVGTTVQSWLSEHVALQGAALGGLGYAAAQVLPDAPAQGGREYHYGVAPQGVLSLRLVAADRVSLDLSAREYFVSNIGGLDGNGRDSITRADASIGVRLYKRNAITVRYLVTSRNVSGADDAAPQSGAAYVLSRSSLALFYTLLGPQHFGAVDWRR